MGSGGWQWVGVLVNRPPHTPQKILQTPLTSSVQGFEGLTVKIFLSDFMNKNPKLVTYGPAASSIHFTARPRGVRPGSNELPVLHSNIRMVVPIPIQRAA